MAKNPALIPELKVLDYAKSLEFYTRLAGFEIVYDRPENDFAMLGYKDARLMIEGINEKSRLWSVGLMERPLGRGMHFQIEVDDVESLYQKFNEAAYPLFLTLEEKGYRAGPREIRHKQFLVQDPDGYLLRFFQEI